jgi:hypothetical protein
LFAALSWFGPPAGAIVQSWLLVTLVGVMIIWMLLGRRAVAPATADGVAMDGPSGATGRAAATGTSAVAVRGVSRRADGSVGLERPPLRFPGPPAKGTDRRVVDYRMVALRAGPNELRTSELGRLDRGDEVEIIESDGGAIHVLTPEGQDGWVPRVTVLRRWTPPEQDHEGSAT